MNHRQINLALQGGGSHGAYTWGVLDRLLEEEDLIIHSVSGTSAGAMNAAILANGYRHGNREGAKKALRHFWTEVSRLGVLVNPAQQSQMEKFSDEWNIDHSLTYQWFSLMTRMFSPYQLNPMNLHPLRDLLDATIDWKIINGGGDINLFITATAVESGQARVFKCHEITTDVLLASACIPFFFQAIQIDGEPYWDGGYMGNPSIWPLLYDTDVHDVLLVQINPLIREGTPTSAHEIINRLNEITFNSSLIGEMRAINFVARLVAENHLTGGNYKAARMHMIPAPDGAFGLNASSKVNTDARFLEFLFGVGREKAQNWLDEHKNSIGRHASLKIDDAFLGKRKVIRGHKDNHRHHKHHHHLHHGHKHPEHAAMPEQEQTK